MRRARDAVNASFCGTAAKQMRKSVWSNEVCGTMPVKLEVFKRFFTHFLTVGVQSESTRPGYLGVWRFRKLVYGPLH